MESRKRKSELELYIDTLTDPPEKQRKMAEFYNSLRLFYKKKWNAPLRLPHVQGVEVNLYRLYDTVMALGGWQKVAAGDKWSDIAQMFGCKDDILCGDHAIKIIYMRYLSKFEQVETIGDVDDYVDNEMSRSRGRNATSFFATNDCPISYNRMHPEQPPRDERGQIITDPDYARLTKSLMSGLPNEVDFAMNVSMLLSHAGPKQLRICHAPTLLTLLVAHTGVYDEDDKSMIELGQDWKRTTRHNFRRFWASSGVPLDLLMNFLDREIESEYVNDEEDDFFTGVSDNFNVKDARCWRLNQVTTIIRNLSFEPANRVTIVKTWPVMKFLIMCASCKWSPLYVAAMDALSNLATDIDLTDKSLVYISQHALLRLITDGIFSLDKFKLVRSLEILTGLCGFEGNESIICDWLKSETISHIFEIVGVKDIMMCVYTLECLYQISEMGDTACDMIADSPKAIQQLISMATLEAVSFGPAGLAGMKVVEYQPNFQPAPQHAPQPHQYQNQNVRMPPQMHHTPLPMTPIQQQMSQQHTNQMNQMAAQAPPMTVRQVIQNNLALQQVQRENLQRDQHRSVPPSPAPTSSTIPFSQPSSSRADKRVVPIPPVPPALTTEEIKLERLTLQWINKNVVAEASICTPRGDFYGAYVDDLRNEHDGLVSHSLIVFSGYVQQLFPDAVFRMDDKGILIVIQGLRMQRPHRFARGAHPLMAKMLATEPNGVNGVTVESRQPEPQKELKKECLEEKPSLNGTIEVCQEPIRASKLFDTENDIKHNAVSIEVRDQFLTDSPAIKTEEKPNGIICNGHSKKTSIATCNLEVENLKINGTVAMTNGNKEEPEEKTPEKEPSPEAETEPVVPKKFVPVSATPTDYMCDWDSCLKFYASPSHTLKHVSEEHVIEERRVLCRWNGCADPTPRNKWSLITHIQDSHCNEHQLKLAAQRRKEGIVINRGIQRVDVVPRDVSNHPGYAKNAAFDAIRRHAFNFLSRELTDEAEGPVTKSIRLTSSLILRNLARYSADGRQKLRRHESHICWLALSRLESSHALSQLLSELHQAPTAEEEQKTLSTAPSSASLSSMAGSSSQLPTIPDSPTTSFVVPPLRKPSVNKVTSTSVNRMLSFSTVSDKPSTSAAAFTPPRHHSIQQHLPSQPSPLVKTTTPVRAGAGI